MTTTATQPVTLPDCPDWCTHLTDPKYSYVPDHSFDLDEDADCNPMRQHSIEYGVVEASRDRVRDTELIPDVFVCLLQSETDTPDGLRRGEFEIAMAADDYPHMTAGEARRVAAMLTAAADKLEELESGSESRLGLPDAADVAAVQCLLEMMDRTGFTSDDQRARYLLSSNWLRDRGAAAAERLS